MKLWRGSGLVFREQRTLPTLSRTASCARCISSVQITEIFVFVTLDNGTCRFGHIFCFLLMCVFLEAFHHERSICSDSERESCCGVQSNIHRCNIVFLSFLPCLPFRSIMSVPSAKFLYPVHHAWTPHVHAWSMVRVQTSATFCCRNGHGPMPPPFARGIDLLG